MLNVIGRNVVEMSPIFRKVPIIFGSVSKIRFGHTATIISNEKSSKKSNAASFEKILHRVPFPLTEVHEIKKDGYCSSLRKKDLKKYLEHEALNQVPQTKLSNLLQGAIRMLSNAIGYEAKEVVIEKQFVHYIDSKDGLHMGAKIHNLEASLAYLLKNDPILSRHFKLNGNKCSIIYEDKG